ncbi:SET domain-containing protein [Neolentinus lepideus HHB14362 ss-1]|uniref:SET domain-containing protein n=1 Tax=Neolentinus lepideus HHB14362 ss-1 TaxID=1314782 RepID=A0A165R7V5_9AGAM|nr:SET domain-containing protein [Neolentinus lepideus HHB14362 ss-1]
MSLDLGKVKLGPHLTARNTAIANVLLRASETILSVPAWITALLLSEKGRRCDWCGCLPSPGCSLKKCTGCGSYWYCGSQCQLQQWKAHHKSICKYYALYEASSAYQSLSNEDKVDAILLSHTLAHLPWSQSDTTQLAEDSPRTVFGSLMQYRPEGFTLPTICGKISSTATNIDSIYARFGNNNFVLHSHLTPFAHGVFPLASRLFNHSCVPNAVARFVLNSGELPRMEMVAISEIRKDEEITIPYLDPAIPLDARQHQLRSRYGFACTCPLCLFQQSISPIPLAAPSDLKSLEATLRLETKVDDTETLTLSRNWNLPSLQEHLYPLLHPAYLPALSETFSKASHEGDYPIALESGLTLLAWYATVYPRNYPLIGMHSLELAKTAWNASIVGISGRSEEETVREARRYLRLAQQVLGVLGPEGDPGGPAEEISTLLELLVE